MNTPSRWYRCGRFSRCSCRFQRRARDSRSREAESMRKDLLSLVLVLLAVAVGLYAVGATPLVPSTAPGAGDIGQALLRSDADASVIGLILVDAAWLIWAWLVFTLVFRVLIDAADVASRGAGWVVALRE